MEKIEKLLEEGRHVELVERVKELYKEIQKAKDWNKKKKLNEWCKNYLQNREIPDKEQELIDLSCVLGVYLAKKQHALKTTQIRKMLERFNKIEGDYEKKAEEFNISNVIKLKPILAYTAARNEESRELVRILDNSINKIRRDGKEGFDYFEKICEFLRGVVAYHKLAGGGD
jgi:CRISPR type III-A-associated protein Csm2